VTQFGRRLTVVNPSDRAWPNAFVSVPCAPLAALVAGIKGVEVSDGDVALPVQLDDLDGDGVPDEFVFAVDLKPKERKVLWLASLQQDESGLTLAKRVHARADLRYVGYAAVESEQAAYGIRCSYPRAQPRGAIQLELLRRAAGEPKLILDTLDSAASGQEDRLQRAVLSATGDSFGLAAPVIGRTRPRDGETASVFHRVLCTGPLRAGVQVDVYKWRTPKGGEYRARLRYFIYVGQPHVELRVWVQALTPSPERFGIGQALFPSPAAVYADPKLGYLGQWGRPAASAPEAGVGLAFAPELVHQVLGAAGASCWAPGSRFVYFQARLDTAPTHSWRVAILAQDAGAGPADRETFRSRLAVLADELRCPVQVDPRPAAEPKR